MVLFFSHNPWQGHLSRYVLLEYDPLTLNLQENSPTNTGEEFPSSQSASYTGEADTDLLVAQRDAKIVREQGNAYNYSTVADDNGKKFILVRRRKKVFPTNTVRVTNGRRGSNLRNSPSLTRNMNMEDEAVVKYSTRSYSSSRRRNTDTEKLRNVGSFSSAVNVNRIKNSAKSLSSPLTGPFQRQVTNSRTILTTPLNTGYPIGGGGVVTFTRQKSNSIDSLSIQEKKNSKRNDNQNNERKKQSGYLASGTNYVGSAFTGKQFRSIYSTTSLEYKGYIKKLRNVITHLFKEAVSHREQELL